MGSRIQKLKAAWWKFVENVLVALIIVGFVGVLVLVFWLDRVRFTF